MIDDNSALADGELLQADLCVVGAGPVGIALALTLAERGRQVLLLEAGRRPLDPQAQALYEGEADDTLHSPPQRFRMRGLGGSSIRWGGRCMPLDPIDFEHRPWVPGSGWPIDAAELAPYWGPATEWAEAGCGGLEAYDAHRALPEAPPMIAGFFSEAVYTRSLERFSCPTDFGRRYRRRLELAPGLRVLQGAVCTALRLSADGLAVRALEVALLDPAGGGIAPRSAPAAAPASASAPGSASAAPRRVTVRPAQVVLAMGGLETARLLLASNDVEAQGVGNAHDTVGRHYMCHLAANLGELRFHGDPAEVRHGYEVSADGIYCRRRLTVAPEVQRRRGLLNAVARLHFPRIADPAHGSGVLSSLFLARRLISYEYGRRLQDSDPTSLRRLLAHAGNVLREGPQTAAFLAHWVWRRELAARKYPSVILRNTRNRFSLEVQAEQVPHPDSRVTLARGVDALGMPRLAVAWRHQPQDIASVAGVMETLAAEFARSGTGRLDWRADTLQADLLRYGAYGGHHLGTARMGRDPRHSVVDRDCRVHGVGNLHIAGAAVFPTSSQANPTLTALALGLRLADHLQPAPAGRSRE